MATFINKKERVFDIELTSYGRYLMSIGKFKPAYYAFYDDNIIYDKNYADASATENQSDIDERIKDTQYIGSLVLFRDVEETLNNGQGASNWYDQQAITARQENPVKDFFKFDAPIGDASIEGMNEKAPAWKIVGLTNKIESVSQTDASNNSIVPQIDITATYTKRIVDPSHNIRESLFSLRDVRTSTFSDGKQIYLDMQDPIFYIEEVNTPINISNFDIEVFEIIPSASAGSRKTLARKNFKTKKRQIVNGIMQFPDESQVNDEEITNKDIEFYFNMMTDSNIEQQTACKAASYFNKKSYYVSLDFDCEEIEKQPVYNDIYGSAMGAEVCLD